MSNLFSYLLVIISSFLYGSSSIVIKYSYLSGLSPIMVMLIQNIVSLILLWGWLLFSGRNVKVPQKLRLPIFLQGALGGFLTTSLFFLTINSLGAALATLLLFTYPAFIALYNIVFRKLSFSGIQVAALVIILVGIGFSVNIFEVKVSSEGIGAILLGLAAAIFNAFTSINGEKLVNAMDIVVIVAWQILFSTAMMIVVYQPWWLLSLDLSWYQFGLLLAGSFITLSPFVIYFNAVRYIGAGTASMIGTLEIPIALVFAWIFLQEKMSSLQILGGILITLSVVTLYYDKSKA